MLITRSAFPVAAVAAAAFAACAAGALAAVQSKPNPANQHHKVRIIADKYVVVDQEPIVVMGDDHGKIVWELPPKPSPYRFKEDGIAIDADQFLGCRPVADGLQYECTDRTPRNRKLYPYRITVHGPDKNAEPLIADAAVQND